MQSKNNHKIIGAFLGTIIEYYDYSLYAFSASIIAAKFFGESNNIDSLIKVFGIYAFAYLSKPIGSLIFGYLGDYYGRKITLSITIVGIAIPTMVIGILPSYSSIGSWSTFILVICRFMQGLFVAGEYDGAAIYVIEHFGEERNATASTITRCTGVVGLLLGIFTTNFCNSHIFPEWGWRIPFLLSVPLALVSLYYRRKLDETPEFKKKHCKNLPVINSIDLIKKQWKTILQIILFAGGFGVTYQIPIIFMKQYLPILLPQTTLIMSTFSIILVLCFGISMVIAGVIADRISRLLVIRLSLYGAILSCILLAVASKYQMINLALGACVLLSVFVAPFNGMAHGIIIKAFPVDERYRSISFGHTIGSMLMSGTANYVCLICMKMLGFDLFPIMYLIAFAVLVYFMALCFEKRSTK
jgi:MHS family proline/betaine transporter-like MFS transporter